MDAVLTRRRGRPRTSASVEVPLSPRLQVALRIAELYATCDVETITTKGGRKLVRFIPRTGTVSQTADKEGV